MPDLSSPVIRYSAFGGTLVKDGPRGQYAGADVAITAPALAVALDADSATYQLMTPTANINVTMPSSVGTPGKRILIRNTTATANVITVLQHADDGGAAIQFVGPGEEKVFVSTGTVVNNWVLVQHQPTTANSNTPVPLVGDVVLGSTEPLQRQYQNLDPGGGTWNATLPAPGGSPGEMFLIRNTGTDWTLDFLQVRTSVPANLLLLGPGEEALFVNDIAGGDYIGIQLLRNPGTAVPAVLGATRVLTQDSAEIQLLQTDGGGARSVVLPVPNALVMRKRFHIVNVSTAGTGALATALITVTDDTGPPPAVGAALVVLNPGDQCVVVPDDGFAGDWRVEEIIRAAGSQVSVGVTVLTFNSPTYQYIDPAGAGPIVVNLPALGLAAGRRAFYIENTSNAGGATAAVELLDVRDSAGGGPIAILYPGDGAWFTMDDTVPNDWRVLEGVGAVGAFLGGVEAWGAQASGFAGAIRAKYNTISHNAIGAGNVTLNLPAASVGLAGKEVLVRATAGDAGGENVVITDGVLTVTVVGGAGPPSEIVQVVCDGAAWILMGRPTTAVV